MALTMVHLLAAERWAQGHPEYLECPEFYLGAISPDAIHIRDHDDKSHKNEIHLGNWQSPHPQEVEAYWRARPRAFDIGYGVHVLTDGQWVSRYKQRLTGMMKPDGRLDVNLYYRDTWVTDFRLYRTEASLRRILDWIAAAQVPADHPLLTRRELDEWRAMTVKAYHGECPKTGEPQFVTEAYVRAFAEDAVALIEETWRAVRGTAE